MCIRDSRHGDAAVDVRLLGGLHGDLVDIIHRLARKIVQPVEVVRIGRDLDARARLIEEDDRLLQHPQALLHILTHRVQVGRQVDGRRENALAALALGLAEQLLPPLGEEAERRLIGREDLDLLALVVQALSLIHIF